MAIGNGSNECLKDPPPPSLNFVVVLCSMIEMFIGGLDSCGFLVLMALVYLVFLRNGLLSTLPPPHAPGSMSGTMRRDTTRHTWSHIARSWGCRSCWTCSDLDLDPDRRVPLAPITPTCCWRSTRRRGSRSTPPLAPSANSASRRWPGSCPGSFLQVSLIVTLMLLCVP